MNYYGARSQQEIKDLIVLVNRKLNDGTDKNCELRIQFMKEIIAVETGFGEVKDTSIHDGMGIAQFDDSGFIFAMNKGEKKHFARIKEVFGVDLYLVTREHLRYDEFLSIILLYMFWRGRPEKIPTTIRDRAKMWKAIYNSELGKGTVEHYLKMCKKYLA